MDLRVLVRTRRHGDTGPRYREILKLNPGPGISVTSGIPATSAATLGTPLVLQKVASELHPKVRNHGEGPY